MPMTYSSLKTDIQTWAENNGTDFNSQLDTFIGNTQNKLSREIDPTGFNQNVQSSTSIGDRFITLPSAIEPMLLNYVNILVNNERQFLEIKPLEYVQEYWPNASITSTPRYFSNFDEKQLFDYDSLYLIFKYFDNILNEMLTEMVPSKLSFKGFNFVYESHSLERFNYNYKNKVYDLEKQDIYYVQTPVLPSKRNKY